MRAVDAGYEFAVLDEVDIVDAAFALHIKVDAALVATDHVSHHSVVHSEIHLDLVSGGAAAVP